MTTIQTHNRCSISAKKIRKIIGDQRYMRANYRKYELLTPREKEVISLLLKGLNNAEIAVKLFISRRTVEQHRKNINNKLSIKNFAHLFRFGYAFDLV